MSTESFERDTLISIVEVAFDLDSGVTSLIGGTVGASARKAGANPPAVVGPQSCTILNETEIRTVFPGNSFTAGVWIIQVWAIVSGVVQTVREEKVKVLPSIPAAS